MIPADWTYTVEFTVDIWSASIGGALIAIAFFWTLILMGDWNMDWFKKLFGFDKGIHTLLFARLQAFAGFVVAVLAAFSWGPLIGLVTGGGFTRGQVLWLAGVLAVQGIVTELVRRFNADDI